MRSAGRENYFSRKSEEDQERSCLRAIQLRRLRAKKQGNGENKNEVNGILISLIKEIIH
jgi:hypothetical protein